MPQGDDPSQSCFTWKNWDKDGHTKYCQDKYGTTPDYGWAFRTFGGLHPAKDFADYTNIVFTNGELDPWRGGGYLKNETSNLIAIRMDKSAHHLDLRAPNAADPPEVISGRAVEKAYISKWILQFQNQATQFIH